jgi:hypothetical protein
MFPTSIEGRIDLPDTTELHADIMAACIVDALRDVRASAIERGGNTITFGGGIFRMVGNWNVLVPVSSGAIEVRAGPDAGISYRFSCLQMLVLVSAMALGVAVVIPASEPVAIRLGAPVAMWAWLFGMNFLISTVRLRTFVRRAACG